MKLCVIGAGAAGLCTVKNALDFACEVTAFEQTSDIGGIWVYTDEVGKDKNGLDVHSSMYQGLRTNLPKEVMGYPNIPFPEQDESFISAEDVYKYYQAYADKFDLRKHIKLEHHVVRVRPLPDKTWEVIVQEMATKSYKTHIFDAVCVCNGHYNSPVFPKIKGQKVFEGKQIHSHDYRTAESFRNEDVLVIGAGPSGKDCVIDISKVAKALTWSHHLEKQPVTRYGENVNQRPDVKEITECGVSFVDGSYQAYSVIIYCTGYKYNFPFLSVDCEVKCENNYVRPLYKHCLSINQPTLGFIGLPNYICPNQMFDMQARFCLTFMTGRKQLQSRDELMRDYKQKEKARSHYIGPDLFDDYHADLATLAEIEPIKPVVSKIFKKCLYALLNDRENFRKDVYKILDDENFSVERKRN